MTSPITRRTFVGIGAATATGLAGLPGRADEARPACTVENEYLKLGIGSNGAVIAFVDKQSGKDYCGGGKAHPCVGIVNGGKRTAVTEAAFADGKITARFGDSGVTAVLRPTVHDRHIVLGSRFYHAGAGRIRLSRHSSYAEGDAGRAVRRVCFGAQSSDERPLDSATGQSPIGELLPAVQVCGGEGGGFGMSVE